MKRAGSIGLLSQGIHPAWIWCVLLILVLSFGVPVVRAQSAASEPLAEVNGETITGEELNRALGATLETRGANL